MPPFSIPAVVSTAWLAGRLGDPALVILDTSWYLPTSGRDARAEFTAGHLPGARFFDLDAASDHDTPLPHMLPTEAAFAAYAGALGVGATSAVVVYDGSGTNLSAARVWWMFRAYGHAAVALLDGGLPRWQAEGRPLEAGMPVVAPARFGARLDRGQVRAAAEVAAALADGSAQVVDCRPAGRFEGRDPEPREGIPSGHMPGARNLPYADLVGPDGTLLPPAALRARLLAAGVDPARPVIASCGSGTSACSLLLALEQLGAAPAALFDGSWTEWAGSGRPVVTGPAR